MIMSDYIETTVRDLLSDVLGLSKDQVAAMNDDTELFGALPELDSMAVAGLLTEMEDRLDIMIDDDEVDGELFATFGNLVAFAQAKSQG
jgi:acyl carrier protein